MDTPVGKIEVRKRVWTAGHLICVSRQAKLSVPLGEKATAIVLLIHGMSAQPEIVVALVGCIIPRLGILHPMLGVRVDIPHGGAGHATQRLFEVQSPVAVASS